MRQNRNKGKACPRAIVGFFEEKGRVNSVPLASLNKSSGLWGRGNTGLACKSQLKELVGGIDSGLADLYMKGMFAGRLYSLGIS